MEQDAKGPSPTDEKGSASWDDSASVEVVNYQEGVDVAVDLVAGQHADDAPLNPTEALKIRRKIDWHLLPLLFLLYTGEIVCRNVFIAQC
jgi:MFS transporter, ACS family, DAL5 transporter family protein